MKMGDRVLENGIGIITNKASEGAFQEFTVVPVCMSSKIPDSLTYEQAVVLPSCVATAAARLFQKGYLEMPFPTADAKSSGKTLLVWVALLVLAQTQSNLR
jgi:NADPH:quinone reductase-like Zn-dependent oxidoreductase